MFMGKLCAIHGFDVKRIDVLVRPTVKNFNWLSQAFSSF